MHKDLSMVPNMVRWSSDGRSIVCTFYGKEAPVVVGKVDGQIEVMHGVGLASAACWAPGDRILAASTRGQGVLRFWDRDAPGERLFTLSFPEEIGDFDWSSQGRLAVWAGQHITLYKLPQRLSSLAQPPVSQVLTAPDLNCGEKGTLRWSPDGVFLAAGTAYGSILCWDLQTQTPVLHWQESVPGRQVNCLTWSSDGALLAVAFNNKRVVVWDMLKKQIRAEWKQLPVVPKMVSLSPAQRLAIASRGGDLLFGDLDDSAPSGRYPGQWLAAWSPVEAEFVTLDAHKETALVIWGE